MDNDESVDRVLTGSSEAQQLIETAAAGNTLELISMLAAYRQSGRPWPVAPAALLFAAVNTQQPAVASMMLSMGSPANLACGQLAAADRAALAEAGIAIEDASLLCPLTIAVRHQNLEMCRLLLHYGAPASRAADGLPILLHFLDAVSAGGGSVAPAAFAGPFSTTSGGASGDGSTSRGTPSGRGTPSSSMPSGRASWGSSGSEDLATFLQGLEQQLQLLQLLLRSGSCPLERPLPPHVDRSFLSACQQPALLRMAVNHVVSQCKRGRQLSTEEAKQLVDAAGRAVLGGF